MGTGDAMQPSPGEPPALDWPGLRRTAERQAYILLGDAEAARDAAQSTLAKLAIRVTLGHVPDRPGAWVITVVRNLARNERRRRGRERNGLARLASAGGGSPSAEPPDDIVARELVNELLAGLPARQRTALTLRYRDDLDGATVAEVMGITPETVKTHLRRGLDAARRQAPLAQDDEDGRDDG